MTIELLVVVWECFQEFGGCLDDLFWFYFQPKFHFEQICLESSKKSQRVINWNILTRQMKNTIIRYQQVNVTVFNNELNADRIISIVTVFSIQSTKTHPPEPSLCKPPGSEYLQMCPLAQVVESVHTQCAPCLPCRFRD